MHRRNFVASLLALPIAHTLDIEKLLWMPGAKRIFIPPVGTRIDVRDYPHVYQFRAEAVGEWVYYGSMLPLGGTWEIRVVDSPPMGEARRH